MSISIKEETIEIGIPRSIKKFANKFSEVNEVKELYKKERRRGKKLEALIRDLEKQFGETDEFVTIIKSHEVIL